MFELTTATAAVVETGGGEESPSANCIGGNLIGNQKKDTNGWANEQTIRRANKGSNGRTN